MTMKSSGSANADFATNFAIELGGPDQYIRASATPDRTSSDSPYISGVGEPRRHNAPHVQRVAPRAMIIHATRDVVAAYWHRLSIPSFDDGRRAELCRTSSAPLSRVRAGSHAKTRTRNSKLPTVEFAERGVGRERMRRFRSSYSFKFSQSFSNSLENSL